MPDNPRGARKVGTDFLPDRNDKGWPQGRTKMPTSAQLGTDFYPDPPVAKGGGAEVGGQNLRGYVRGGADGNRGSTPTDATVAADGTRRCKSL